MGIPLIAWAWLPLLLAVQMTVWPDVPMPSYLAAQIETETCITLKHPKCWNPTAELKTSREYGFGFGQVTIAYRSDGSVRFNKFEELRQQFSSLRGWTWNNRFDARYQITAIVEMNKDLYRGLRPLASSDYDGVAFTDSAYNGGRGDLLKDRRLCANTSGCDPGRWFGHVEHTSVKSRVVMNGYGRSPYDINRQHVADVMKTRRVKYVPVMEGGP